MYLSALYTQTNAFWEIHLTEDWVEDNSRTFVWDTSSTRGSTYAGGRKTAHSTSEVAPHTTLHADHHLAAWLLATNPSCSAVCVLFSPPFPTQSLAAAQYVKGIELAKRNAICVCADMSSVEPRKRACIACGATERSAARSR